MKNIIPLGKRILVRREDPIKMKGSLYLPDAAKEKQREGIVIALGSVRTSSPLDIGDRVLFNPYAGAEVKGYDEDLLLLLEDDVLCIIEPEED